MAITKILHINEVDMGNPARHLEQALDYIQNPEKDKWKCSGGQYKLLAGNSI